MFQPFEKEPDEKAIARERLDALIQAEPNNESAWLELAEAVEHDNEAIDCLRQALRINPGNAAAQQKLDQLQKLEQEKPSEPAEAISDPILETKTSPPSENSPDDTLSTVLGIVDTVISIASLFSDSKM